MKIFLFVISVSFLFSGCSAGVKKTDYKNWADSFVKMQRIEVISSDESGLVSIVTDSQDIAAFIKALKMDEWEVKEIPADAIKGKEFGFYQQETIKFGKSNEDKKELLQIASITTYRNIPYIDISLKKVNLSFKVPEEVYKYLSEYK